MTDIQSTAVPIAVVGMSAIYPGESGLVGYWRTIVSGRDAISDVPASHWLIDDYYDADPNAPDKTYCRRGGFITPVAFDPMQFGLPPNALPATDSAQLLALIAAKQALDQASHGQTKVDPDRISVVLGVASTTELVVHMGARLQRPVWRKALLENGVPEAEADAICDDIAAEYAPWQESTFPGLLGNVVAGRIANRLNLGGANFVTDAACASSLSALQVALHQLYLNEADMVLTGGVDALNDIMMFMCFSKTPAFSATGDCRPFSDTADGTIIGEGVGMLALKRLSDAERDGDMIHAVIRGLGSSSDGRASSVYAPRSEGQAKALRLAYERAGYLPSTVELLEAHGTATKAGDVAEFSGLASVFASGGTAAPTRCALGSVKSQIGHTKAAAGAAGLIKAVLALQHATLPATIKVDRPNAALGLEKTPFYVNSQIRPWVRDGGHPRRASVSSFGFGGSNFHVTLEEYRGRGSAKRVRALPCELVVLSAASARELAQRCRTLEASCNRSESIAKLAFDAAASFEYRDAARAGVVAADTASLAGLMNKLAAALDAGDWKSLRDPDIAVSIGPARTGKTAFLFPGQGSQYVGMGADLALAFPEALSVWDHLAGEAGLSDLPGVVFPEPAFDAATRERQVAALTAMVNAQPALAATSLAQLALLERLGVSGDVFAGHSFGEVTALAAAGALPKEKLVAIGRKRGELMTHAAGAARGAMLAVAARAEEVEALLAGEPGIEERVTLANDNAPRQVVLSGPIEGIERVEAFMKSSGLTTFRLPVASAFHSPIVASSCEPFAAFLKEIKFSKPKGAVYSNATAKPYGRSPGAQLADQLQRPVRFREMIEAMASEGVTRFVEVGSGRVLTTLVDQILLETPHLAVALDDRKAGALRGWNRGLAALAADGVRLDLAALYENYEQPEPQPAIPAHAVLVGGANLGKPYPPKEGSAPKWPRSPRVAPSASLHALPSPAPPPPTPAEETAPNLFNPAPSARQAWSGDFAASDDAWGVIDRIQAETVEQHRHFLDVMARSHEAFLQMSAQMLDHLIGGTASAALPAPAHPTVAPVAPVVPLKPTVMAPPVVAASPAPTTPKEARPSRSRPVGRPEDVVLAIVVEKTGYPLDMLNLDMEMEAELGIDSIKQVEILAGVQERFPDAPEIPASELSKLKTLRDVVDAIAAFASEPITADETVPTRVANSQKGPASPDAVHASVMSIVAEKTGYPQDMLNLDMEMEAELGIDSIKQVEILSALQERWPDAPEVSASDLAGLKTLRDVSNAIASFGSAGTSTRASASMTVESKGLQSPTISTMEIILEERPPSGFAMSGLSDGRTVYVTREDPDFADDVVAALDGRGISAAAVEAPPAGASAVISLAALIQARDAVQSLGVHLRAFQAAQVVARSEGAPRLFVTVQNSGGSFGIGAATVPGSALSCGVAGLIKTAAREWEKASVKAIDLQSLDAKRLVDELISGGPDLEVALRSDGSRCVVSERASETPHSGEVSLPSGGVLVVSGGARGVTARCAIALAQRTGARLALLGRTDANAVADAFSELSSSAELAAGIVETSRRDGEPVALAEARRRASRILAQREIASTLKLALGSGVEARYYSVDVADAESVVEVISGVRREFGPIVGLIHGAGVLADKLLADLDEAQFNAVFSPKVAGAEALIAATRDDDLRMVALFSSIAARMGNAGQAAYAAANEVLNAVAVRERMRRGPKCAVHAFGWGPWDGGMVDATLRRRFEQAGVGLIDIEAGAEYFADRACRVHASPVTVVAAPGMQTLRHIVTNWAVSKRALPPLADHVVQNRIVLPVVVVLERILRAAKAVSPSTDACASIRDFQVLSGVTLPVDADEEMWLSMEFEPKGASYVVTLRDSAQRSRYRAVVEWREATTFQASASIDTPVTPWDVTIKQAYAGPLFHGARFEALIRLEGVDGNGGVAVMKRSTDLGWPEEPWATDPAALDGGLQLGLLWANANKRGIMLPQRIAGFTQYAAPPTGAQLRCRFAARPVSEKRVDFDFVIETLTGDLVGEISGAEFYALGAGASAAP